MHQRICECIDFGKLADIEQHIAVELARCSTISDAEMLAGARSVIARVLHSIADARTRVRRCDEEEDFDTRYLNAICCEGLEEPLASPEVTRT